MQQLSGGVQMVRDEQSTFKQRDIVTSNRTQPLSGIRDLMKLMTLYLHVLTPVSEATNAQVLWFSLIELFALILAVAYQIYNIQTMFEGKLIWPLLESDTPPSPASLLAVQLIASSSCLSPSFPCAVKHSL